MKVQDMINLLEDLEKNAEVIIFAEGKFYPSLIIENTEYGVEIGCGWEEIEFDDQY